MKRLTLLLLVCGAAAAQSALADVQPSLDAVRAACADDAQKLCAGVQPGGGRIVVCLKEHKDSLSERCKQAAGLPVGQSSSPAPVAAAAAVTVPAAAQTKPAPASKANPAKASPAKANPAKFNIGSVSVGSGQHMTTITIGVIMLGIAQGAEGQREIRLIAMHRSK